MAAHLSLNGAANAPGQWRAPHACNGWGMQPLPPPTSMGRHQRLRWRDTPYLVPSYLVPSYLVPSYLVPSYLVPSYLVPYLVPPATPCGLQWRHELRLGCPPHVTAAPRSPIRLPPVTATRHLRGKRGAAGASSRRCKPSSRPSRRQRFRCRRPRSGGCGRRAPAASAATPRRSGAHGQWHAGRAACYHGFAADGAAECRRRAGGGGAAADSTAASAAAPATRSRHGDDATGDGRAAPDALWHPTSLQRLIVPAELQPERCLPCQQ